jgi:hypothetical protein
MTPRCRHANGKLTAEYLAWMNARARCLNPRHSAFRNYGGRGLTVDYKSFAEFLEDVGPRPSDDLSLERVDNNAGYVVGNCVWADRYGTAIGDRWRGIRLAAFAAQHEVAYDADD